MTPRVTTHRDIVVFTVIANDQLLQCKSQSFIGTEGHLSLKNEQTLSDSRTKFRLRVEQKYKTLPQEKKGRNSLSHEVLVDRNYVPCLFY